MKKPNLNNPGGPKALTIALLMLYALLYTPAPDVDAAKIYPSAGTTSASFLKIGAGARAAGMAGAFTALADDPYAAYWNPAGLNYLREKNLSFTHNDYFESLKQEFLVYTLPGSDLKFLKNKTLASGVWGFGLNYLYTPKDIERRSGLYEGDPLSPISPVEGKFRAYDMALSASYGFNYREGLDLGATLKYIRQAIDDESANTAALDLGALYNFNWRDRNFTAGFAVQNLGPGLKFINRRYALPLTFKAGLSHRIYESGLLLAFDLSKPIDNYPFLLLGLEYPLSSRLYLRSGYRYRINGNELGAWSGVAAGAGLALNNFAFNYAFSPFGDLGDTHRFSVSLKFSRPQKTGLKAAGGAMTSPEAGLNGRTEVYEVTPRALTISPQGVKYEITARNEASGLYSMQFRIFRRGPAAVNVSVTEGDLPEPLIKELPAGVIPLKVWQISSTLGNVQGDIAFKLKLKKTAGPAETAFLYRTRKGWEQAKLEAASSDEEFSYFEAEAPVSAYYVAATKSN